MQIDLKKDLERVTKYIAKRCDDYSVYINAGPGKGEDAIRLITLGFEFEQAGWISLVFDTRPDAKFDGEWQGYISENEEPFDEWFKAFDDMIEKDLALSLTQHNGKQCLLTAEAGLEDLAACIGVMCRDALLQARQEGLFKKLPLSDDCRLAVEEHEGNYGWVEGGADAEEVDEDEVMDSMRRTAKKLTKTKQIEYWIGQLDDISAENPCDAAKIVYCDEFVLEELSELGVDAIIPLLTWANTWADKPEFRSSPDEDEDCEYPISGVLYNVFDRLVAIPGVEQLVQQYIRTAIKVKPKVSIDLESKKTQEIFGIIPYHAARFLYRNYDGYPEPIADSENNKLLNAERFVGEE